MIYTKEYLSPLGLIKIACNKEAIVGLWFVGQKNFESSIKDIKIINEDHPLLIKCSNWLDAYFNKQEPSLNKLNLDLSGSDFQVSVYKILKEIPYGQTMTYKEIANILAKQRGLKTMSAQAVGSAVGKNPISILIPCHRVVGTDKSLRGFASGLSNKIALLKIEGQDTSIYLKDN